MAARSSRYTHGDQADWQRDFDAAKTAACKEKSRQNLYTLHTTTLSQGRPSVHSTPAFNQCTYTARIVLSWLSPQPESRHDKLPSRRWYAHLV